MDLVNLLSFHLEETMQALLMLNTGPEFSKPNVITSVTGLEDKELVNNSPSDR